jgi:hypothetical protein
MLIWAQRQPPPTFNFGLASNFFFVYRTLSMRQKTKNHQNQGSIDKKFDFFSQSLSHIPRCVHLVQKTPAKNSHAWAPLNKFSKVLLPLVLLTVTHPRYFIIKMFTQTQSSSVPLGQFMNTKGNYRKM